MLFSPSRIRVAAAAVMMLFATQTFAAPGDSKAVLHNAVRLNVLSDNGNNVADCALGATMI